MDDWLLQPAKGTSRTTQDSDGPVFVDESGRRSHRFRRLGIVVGIACAAYLVVILAAILSGSPNAPWLPRSDQDADTPAGRVDASLGPSDPAEPSRSASIALSADAPAGDRTARSAGASARPNPSDSAVTPAASTAPEPTTSSVKPTSGRTTNAASEPPTPVDSAPEPTRSGGGVTPDPSQSRASGGPVIDGSVEPTGLGTGSTGRSSPENVL